MFQYFATLRVFESRTNLGFDNFDASFQSFVTREDASYHLAFD